MTQQIDENLLTILYHHLGAGFDQGLRRFEEAFEAAETEYRLDALEALLGVLNDSTLHDPRRPVWYHCYAARKALLQWKPAEAEQHLQQVEIEEGQWLLHIRKDLLDGKTHVQRGEWAKGIELLEGAETRAIEHKEFRLQAEAAQAVAATYVAWARSCGDWQEPASRGFGRLWQRFFTVLMTPLFLALRVYLNRIGYSGIWKAGPRYFANYSNWPIFWYLSRALQALERAERAEAADPTGRRFRLQLMRADLMRRLCDDEAAQGIYEKEKHSLSAGSSDVENYQLAMVNSGLARTKMDLGQSAQAKSLLAAARSTYLRMKDVNSWSHALMLLGDVALETGSPSVALRNYRIALRILARDRDLAGLAEALGRTYRFMDEEMPTRLLRSAQSIIDEVEPKVFTVRMAGRLYDLLNLASWVIPLIAALALAAIASYPIIRAPVFGLNIFWQALLSWRTLLVVGGAWVTLSGIMLLLGLVGLVSTLRRSRMSLDYIVIDRTALDYRSLEAGHSARLVWSEIAAYVRVERGIGRTPTRTLCFEFLRKADGEAVRIPGSVVWHSHLRRAIEQNIGAPSRNYRMLNVGIEAFGLIVLSAAVFAVVFALAQLPLPALAAHMRAGMSAIMTAGYYLALFSVTARWLWNIMSAGYALEPAARFSGALALLGIFLAGVGLLTKPVFLLWSPAIIFWGVFLLFGVVRKHVTERLGPGFAWGIQGVGLLVSSALVLRAVVPLVLNLYAYAYFGAAIGFDPGNSTPPTSEVRVEYFRQMRAAGQWMNRIDPSYPFAYGYRGYAEYYDGNYTQSVDYYTKGLSSFVPFTPPPDFYYCRAVAYIKLDLKDLAQRDCEAFANANASGTNCELLFPEEAGSCS